MTNAERISEIMRAANLYGDVWDENEHTVAVEISWGDWKHEHAALVWLVTEKLPDVKRVTGEIIEEDGSDCYSAIHHFYF